MFLCSSRAEPVVEAPPRWMIASDFPGEMNHDEMIITSTEMMQHVLNDIDRELNSSIPPRPQPRQQQQPIQRRQMRQPAMQYRGVESSNSVQSISPRDQTYYDRPVTPVQVQQHHYPQQHSPQHQHQHQHQHLQHQQQYQQHHQQQQQQQQRCGQNQTRPTAPCSPVSHSRLSPQSPCPSMSYAPSHSPVSSSQHRMMDNAISYSSPESTSMMLQSVQSTSRSASFPKMMNNNMRCGGNGHGNGIANGNGNVMTPAMNGGNITYSKTADNLQSLQSLDLNRSSMHKSKTEPVINGMESHPRSRGAVHIRFTVPNDGKLQLKDHIFISKDCTYRLGQYIVKENWGKQCSLLYKYLDYIFRCQVFKRQIVELHHCRNPRVQFLVLHSGLQRRSDNEFLYVLLVPNAMTKLQKWRVQYGNIRNSFMSKDELLSKLRESGISIVNESDLPQRTKFTESLSDLLFDESRSIQANWEERLTTNQDRIYKVMGSAAFFDDSNKFLKLSELIEAFETALPKTERLAQLNPRLAVAQGFVDTKHSKFRMELLVPIIIRFPKRNGNFYKFALALGKSQESKRYVVKSILTLDMAYANARLVGYVDSLWLYFGNKRSDNLDLNDFCLNP